MVSKIYMVWVAVFFLAGFYSSTADCREPYYAPSYETPRSYRSYTVSDSIDIQTAENELIGIVEGHNEYSIDLELGEKIVWRGTRGTVGAVLTENRILALSRVSRGWAELPLKLNESDKLESITPLISDFLVMIVTGRRIITFDSQRGRWVQQSIPVHDRIVDSHINSHVAAVITSKRMFAWAVGSIGFKEQRLRRSESIQSVDTQSHTVTVRTDRRLLVFKSGGGGGWREF